MSANTCTTESVNTSGTDVIAYATRDDLVNLVRKLLLPRGNDGSTFGETQIGSATVDGFLENPVCVHRAAHQIAALAESGELNEDEWPELYEHPDELIEEHDPDADRSAAQEIVTLLTEAWGL
ncbi:hypothetical protein [Nonomuraea wenchangensis]|uniref:Uncharacterized protein n=1 Tax=Nonomuraea wenchangensis TaxID=568860 RepID=A0A1I0LTK6_9ACTN|nr:hypothetical protein [Nonomuraea wenchangensis]SEU46334.1 hypothetical protein SAMN05421811_1274 [Nonomuraea wenchangensis]